MKKQSQGKTRPPAAGRPAVSSAPAGPVPRNVERLSTYDNDALDQRPSITRRVAPEYPTKARRMNVQGTVTVQLVVDTAGKPRNYVVVKATPGGYFEEAALDAAHSMRFVPGKLKGLPVNTLVQLPFAFRLR
ncbi:energy transducer TonB [Desulfovibrio falkowii]|uniref:TonB C-terminal domain-containing protein n=1 Tax=Desulfovibrio falkowii TaxID=3136602 RepID=A0ABQ0E861_9BACT